MLALNLRRQRAAALRDPAPSKWGYRYQRMMLTPGVRGLVRVGVPLVLLAAMGTSWYSHDDNRAQFAAFVEQTKAGLQHRPEFMVTGLEVEGADEILADDVAVLIPLQYPVSSFDLDLEQIRVTVEALHSVANARVRIGEGGALQIEVTPRVPVALWRDEETLRLIDANGVFSGVVQARAERLELPLIAGDGAQENIAEALALFERAGPIRPRVRGLVRMGERRWDLVLDRGQRILLPEDNAASALDRVIALGKVHDLLARDVAMIDMRNGQRPTVRMTQEATAALRNVAQTGE